MTHSLEAILWGAARGRIWPERYRRITGPIVEQSPMIEFRFLKRPIPRILSSALNIMRRELKQLPKHKDGPTQRIKSADAYNGWLNLLLQKLR